jgi:hypothetical protein
MSLKMQRRLTRDEVKDTAERMRDSYNEVIEAMKIDHDDETLYWALRELAGLAQTLASGARPEDVRPIDDGGAVCDASSAAAS